ncbi:SPOR domain-containing protein [Lacibacterium aquatile]|uniref:SPOR domain-containing protein n=1 Tax=Lacibacterium aquatile TaxID=1168082 RepID=A0ABW5DPD3_9PROT
MQQDFDPRDLEPALTSQEASGSGRGKLIPAMVAVVALVGFGGIVWYAYSQGARQVAGETAPLIKADAGPMKVKPDDPGGLAVPNRDSLLLNNPGHSDAPRVERILPSPEQPLPVPQPPAAAPTETASLPPAIGGSRPPVAAPAAPPAAVVPAPQTVATNSPPPKPVAPPAAPAAQPVALTPPKPAPAPAAAPTAPKPVVATPAPVAAAPVASIKGAKIQLGSVRSVEAASSEWAKLQRTHPELGSLSMQASKVDIAGKGTFYRVQAGPLADAGAASQLCGSLKAKNQDCIVVR